MRDETDEGPGDNQALAPFGSRYDALRRAGLAIAGELCGADPTGRALAVAMVPHIELLRAVVESHDAMKAPSVEVVPYEPCDDPECHVAGVKGHRHD